MLIKLYDLQREFEISNEKQSDCTLSPPKICNIILTESITVSLRIENKGSDLKQEKKQNTRWSQNGRMEGKQLKYKALTSNRELKMGGKRDLRCNLLNNSLC